MSNRKQSTPPRSPPSVLQWSGLLRRDTLLFLALLLLTLASALAVVYTAHRNGTAFNELQQLKEEAVRLDVARGQLLIERSTFGVDGRIERKAREELGLRIPQAEDIVVVEMAP